MKHLNYLQKSHALNAFVSFWLSVAIFDDQIDVKLKNIFA